AYISKLLCVFIRKIKVVFITMKKIEIFDPAMCCSTGVCVPSVDPELIRMAAVTENLKAKGYDITRYNLANEPHAFAGSTVISQLLKEKGPDVLPVTVVDGEVKKVKEFLTNEELQEITGLTKETLAAKPRIQL